MVEGKAPPPIPCGAPAPGRWRVCPVKATSTGHRSRRATFFKLVAVKRHTNGKPEAVAR